ALTAALAERPIEVIIDQEMQTELARIETDFRLRAPHSLPMESPLIPAPASTAPLPQRILLVTHNLNLEGAPLFLVDYAEHLARAGAVLTILSPTDGPLRSRFEQFGAQIKLLDVSTILAAPTAQAAHKAIRQLGRTFDFTAFDLVVGNTFTTFWAVHAAKAAQRRVLLYVHESTTPASFYIGRMAPEVIALVTAAFALADCVSFTTAATRAYHLDYGRPTQHRLTPGWIDLARIDAWRAKHPRAALRAQFGLQPHELLVTNVGTVCDRKGQHIFARAVDLLWRRYPALAARTRFIMLGGGETPFDAVLADLLTHLGRTNLNVHPGTSDYFPYYAAADLFVCSTYEESSPRVILEAMACSTPILSSDVHGIPEQVLPSLEAKLVPPGDTVALCEGMAELLLNPEMSNEYATRARTRIANEFAATIGLPRHA
ncbi:MAG: glycosyltransferase family 1 protein, partial [Opitutaceae bacterium]|nr:glycosyltransferase family 1 protein [Opitutaceae bacterium]